MSTVITLYESNWCGFCRAARRLLDKKGWEYNSILVDGNAPKRREMEERSGRHTVPQIFFGDTHVGGFDDMAEMESSQTLDALYESASESGGNTPD